MYYKGLILLLLALGTGCTHGLKKQNAENQHVLIDQMYQLNGRHPAYLPPKEVIEGKQVVDEVYAKTQSDFLFTKGEMIEQAGQTLEASNLYHEALVYSPESTSLRIKLASQYLSLGQLDKVINELNFVIEKEPNNYQALSLMGMALSSVKQYDQAEAFLQKALAISPQHEQSIVYLGAVLVETRQHDKAISSFKKLINQKSEMSYLAWYYIGKIYQEKGESFLNKSIESFETSLNMKPTFEPALMELASIYYNFDQTDKAINAFLAFYEAGGKSSRVTEVLSSYYLENKQFDKAQALLDDMLVNDKDNISLKLKLAYVQIQNKDFEPAIIHLNDILVVMPEADRVHFYLAIVYEEVEEFQKAIEHFNHVPKESDYFNESVVHASYLYKMDGKIDKAIEVLKGPLEDGRRHLPFYTLSASYLDEKGKYAEAIKFLEEGKKYFPTEPKIPFLMALIWEKRKSIENTIFYMEQVLLLNPNHIDALNYVAYNFAETNKNLDRAEKLAKKALALSENNPFVIDTLGWVYFKKGNYKEALIHLNKALELLPAESIVAEHLGDVYIKIRQPQKAQAMYENALQNESNIEKQQEITTKLAGITIYGSPSISVSSKTVDTNTDSSVAQKNIQSNIQNAGSITGNITGNITDALQGVRAPASIEQPSGILTEIPQETPAK